MSRRSLRRRFWIEFGLAATFAFLALATLIVPDWAEALFGFDPDVGGGAFEIAVTMLTLAGTVAFVLAARLERRRTLGRPSPSQSPDSRP